MNFFKKNYDKNLYNHVKGGTVGQIVNFILFIGIAALSLLCEWWSIGMYGESFGLGILTSILTIGLISFTVQTGFTNTAVCFKSTVVAIFESIAAKVDDKIFEKQMAQNGQNPELARQKLEEIKANIPDDQPEEEVVDENGKKQNVDKVVGNYIMIKMLDPDKPIENVENYMKIDYMMEQQQEKLLVVM